MKITCRKFRCKNLQLKKVSKFFSTKFCKSFSSLNSFDLIVFYFKNCHVLFLFSICTVTCWIWCVWHFCTPNIQFAAIFYLLLISSYLVLSAKCTIFFVGNWALVFYIVIILLLSKYINSINDVFQYITNKFRVPFLHSRKLIN